MWREIVPAAISALIGVLAGYVISRVCWARKVSEQLAVLDVKVHLIMVHLGLETKGSL